MSGIYIPGMEMPKSCLECRLYNDPWCMAKNRNQWRTAYNRPLNGERQDDCPLIHIPPHGRLIDADALRQTMYHEAFETDSPMQKWDSGCWIRYKMFERMEEAAPTIIEAEEAQE